jgi:membrane protein DedA with SNARE-associated domain
MWSPFSSRPDFGALRRVHTADHYRSCVASPLVRRLVLVLTSGLFVLGTIGSNIGPALVDERPELVLLLSSRNRNLFGSVPYIDLAPYVLIGFLRVLAAALALYYCGRFFGEKAVRWLEGQAGEPPRIYVWLERAVAKLGNWAVIIFPGSNIVCLLVGHRGMPPRRFFVLVCIGIAIKLWVLRVFGRVLENEIRAFLDFIDKYQWWVVIGLFAVSLLQGQFRRGPTRPD